MIVALVALGLVIRFEPSWASIELQQAAKKCDINPQALSRLVTRAIGGFGALLKGWTRRGRPPANCKADELRLELERANALLRVTTSLLATVQLGRGQMREQIVGAYDRLHNDLGMSQKRFCEALFLPVRTLRSWLAKARGQYPPTPPPPKPKPKPKRDPRRGRFGFDVVLPDTMKAADTTSITVLGVELKLIAVQDVGGRDANLLDGVLVGPTETSEMVAKLMTECLAGCAGAQMLTDQGTPYMAKHTVETLDALEVEHAPQREGHPTGKATIERAFRSLKDAAQHLLALTNHLSTSHPQLRDPNLAASLTHLIVDALLRAYQHGARMAQTALEQRANLDPGKLEKVADQAREQARAVDRSARLLLSHIHDLYDIARDKKRFVDGLRLYPLQVLQEAEKQFSKQVHRDDIRDRASYFAALVRRCHDPYRARRARLQQEARERQQREEHDRAVEQQRQEHAAAPAKMIREGLELIVLQWDSATKQLLFDGAGPGQGMLHKAFCALTNSLDVTTARDIVRGALLDFEISHKSLQNTDAIRLISALVDKVVGGTKTGAPPTRLVELFAN
ncbi:MAG: hypothetical protein JRH20_26885 [Deltaproteobacteria bacterium]|nr:hypothetical protein [Deltaproteobacteria bacterium]